MWDKEKSLGTPFPLLSSPLPPLQNSTCSTQLVCPQSPGFEEITICCTKVYTNGCHSPPLYRPVEESPLLPPHLQISVMKIRVRRRLPKIRTLISAPLRLCRLISSLVRKISARMSRDRTPRTLLSLCLRRPQMVRSFLRPRSRDRGSIARRRKMVPRGCVPVYVGEEQQRFVIPILYLSHPFLTQLLAKKEAEGELAYTYGGPLTVPCDVGDFEQVKWLIDRETTAIFLNGSS